MFPAPVHLTTVENKEAYFVDEKNSEPTEYESNPPNLKISMCQIESLGQFAVSKWLDEFLTDQAERTGRKPDIVVFSECFVPNSGSVDLKKHKLLENVSKVVKKHAVLVVLGTMTEIVKDRYYCTAVVFAEDGSILGKYQKQRTHHGLSEGDQSCLFETKNGVKFTILICLDVEHFEVVNAAVEPKPLLLINPAFIPPPSSSRKYKSMAQNNRNAATQMFSRKFERFASEHHITLIRVDAPFQNAMGTTMMVGPYETSFSSSMKSCVTNVFVNIDDEKDCPNNLWKTARLPDHIRSHQLDNTGSRISVFRYSRTPPNVSDVHCISFGLTSLLLGLDSAFQYYNNIITRPTEFTEVPLQHKALLVHQIGKDLVVLTANGELCRYAISALKSGESDIVFDAQRPLKGGLFDERKKEFVVWGDDVIFAVSSQTFDVLAQTELEVVLATLVTEDLLSVVSGNGSVILFDREFRSVQQWKDTTGKDAVVLSDDGQMFVVGIVKDGIGIFRNDEGETVRVAENTDYGQPVAMCSVAGGTVLVCTFVDGCVRVFTACGQQIELVHTLFGDGSVVNVLGFDGAEKRMWGATQEHVLLWKFIYNQHPVTLEHLLTK